MASGPQCEKCATAMGAEDLTSKVTIIDSQKLVTVGTGELAFHDGWPDNRVKIKEWHISARRLLHFYEKKIGISRMPARV